MSATKECLMSAVLSAPVRPYLRTKPDIARCAQKCVLTEFKGEFK